MLIGIITRSAPSLNLFSFGFPIALISVFIFLYLGVEPISNAFSDLTAMTINLLTKFFILTKKEIHKMAEEDNSQDKTEEPSQRKLDKAAEDGQVLSSKEMFVFTS